MEEIEKDFDNKIKAIMSKATSIVLNENIPDGLVKKFPKNNVTAMVSAGAKGSSVN